MSKIIIDGEEVKNVTGIDIVATANEPIPKVILTLSGNQIATGVLERTDMFIQPSCPNCGFNGEKFKLEDIVGEIGEDSPTEPAPVSEGSSLRSDPSL